MRVTGCLSEEKDVFDLYVRIDLLDGLREVLFLPFGVYALEKQCVRADVDDDVFVPAGHD